MQDRPFKLMAWHIRDFKTIQVRDVQPNGEHVEITGPNASGKTSHLDSILFALCGLDKNQPLPIRHGANEAEVCITIDNGNPDDELMITRGVDRDGKMFLEVLRGGSAVKSAKQTVINTLLSKYMLNPVDFLKLRPQDMKDALLQLCKEPPPVDKVQEITGREYKAKEGDTAYSYLTRLSGDKDGVFYELRKQAGAKVDQAEAALVDAKRNCAPKVDEPADMKVLTAQLQELEAIQKVSRDKAAALDATRQRYDLARRQQAAAEQAVTNAQATLDAAKLELARKMDDVEQVTAAGQLAKLDAEQHPDRTADLEAMRAQFATVASKQKAYAEWQASQERINRLIVARKEADVAYDAANETLAKLRTLRQDVIRGIDIGVAGLECGDEGLTIEGVPLPAASMAQQIKVACGVAIKQNPQLRLMRVDEGERLDHRSRMQLYNIADQNDCQVVLTSVSNDDNLTVKIVE